MALAARTDIVNLEMVRDLTQIVIPKDPNCEFDCIIDTYEFRIRTVTGINNVSYISIISQEDTPKVLCWERHIKVFVNLTLSSVHMFSFFPMSVYTIPPRYNYLDFQSKIGLYHGYWI